jgi:hypothetical protein
VVRSGAGMGVSSGHSGVGCKTRTIGGGECGVEEKGK